MGEPQRGQVPDLSVSPACFLPREAPETPGLGSDEALLILWPRYRKRLPGHRSPSGSSASRVRRIAAMPASPTMRAR